MLEEERNKYFEQARQATLSEIAGNQQAMLDSAMAPAAPEMLDDVVVEDSRIQMPSLQGQAVTSNTGGLVGERPQGVPVQQAAAAPAQPFQNPLNPNLVAEAAQQQPGVYVGGGMTMPAGLAQQANNAAAAALSPTPFDDVVDEVDAVKAEQAKQAEIEKALDPRIQRAENARKWVSGIGDALASVANLVGTGHFASNQKQTYSLPGVNEAIEKDRARRQTAYQKQLDRLNALEIQAAKDKQAEAEREAKKAENEAKRAFDREKWEAEKEHKKNQLQRQLDQDQFNNDLNTRKQEENERHNRSQESINWYKAKKGDDPSGGEGDGNGSGSRFSGKRGGGIKEAKTDYNSMLDEIAEKNGCESWADLTNRAKSDRTLREIHNKFDLGKDKAGAAKIEGMISSYAKNYAPEFYEHYFGKSAGDGNVDFNAFKPAAAPSAAAPSGGGTLSGIMSSTPQEAGKKKRKNK